MSKFVKKELDDSKYLFYCNLSVYGKSKRIIEKATKIVNHQIENYYDHY